MNQPASRTTSKVETTEEVIPVVEETLSTRKREVETGKVQVRQVVREHVETVDELLYQESVEFRRVPVDEFVDEVPPVREEGDTIVVPVVEEVLVVEKRLRLIEEVHVRKERSMAHKPQEVTLRRTEVVVEREAPQDGTVQQDDGTQP